jgi:hypothetical protein
MNMLWIVTDITTLPDGTEYRILADFSDQGQIIQTRDDIGLTAPSDDQVAMLGDPAFYDVNTGGCIAPWQTYTAPVDNLDAYQAAVDLAAEQFLSPATAAQMVDAVNTARNNIAGKTTVVTHG